MRSQLSTVLLGLGIAATAAAQAPILNQGGPFALRVKGQAWNSSIDVNRKATKWDSSYRIRVAGSGFYGRAMSLQYNAGSNVAFALTGAGAATSTGFDQDNKTPVNIYFNDSTFVPGQQPALDQSFEFYNWAICWQFFGRVYMPSLSWITSGPSHNPTCERVDLIKVAL
ncbi:hypothetical protein F5B21DRAFT_503084 [Xylaria acuta]|nr:hypothetical protein F5B21DRAFT_503084 [Xylaria acuta]